MTNIRQLNQDNVLNIGDEELSPNDFSAKKSGEDMNIEDDEHVLPKRKSTLLPLVAGIVIAICIVVFFGWKMASPYFKRGDASRDAFTPIDATTHHVQPFEPSPSTATTTDQNVSTTLNSPPIQMLQNTSSGVPSALLIAAPEVQAVNMSKPVDSTAIMQAVPAHSSLVNKADALPAGPSAEEITQINKRIDSFGVEVKTLKDVVEKLKSQSQAKQGSVPHVVVSKHEPAVVNKAVTPKVGAAIKEKADAVKSGNSAAGGMQLQAVLQDRAWFKAANGETFTVSPGEELKGVGIVQQIDADSGRVIFTNGLVYR